MSSDTHFTRENLDFYLRELAKEYRKLGGKNMPAEVILIAARPSWLIMASEI
ncbi:hypothetical protein CAFE_09580 [Caprobacter fermentans]|uniref:Uncharacterized protein n=1 Tax=Caproicibacter fermentans TaxID=2576756 RepID=A0A6N8HWU3_9FIRM|nr:hypothetical protein [Caproicibacter fermentans]MVB10276.1 hypothetical protein [Caproicibacter fermentans]